MEAEASMGNSLHDIGGTLAEAYDKVATTQRTL